MSNDEGEAETKPKRKKGVKQVIYKHERIKQARLSNQEYVNWKGNLVKPKPHGYPCNCKKKCVPVLINESDLEELYQSFVSMSSKDEQDLYLQSLIKVFDIKRHRSRTLDASNLRNKSFKYYVALPHSAADRFQVCKTGFLSSFGVSEDRVRRLCTLLMFGESPVDQRGKSTPGNAKSAHVIKSIIKHVASFPTNLSHRAIKKEQVPDQHLDTNLNVKKMWELFIEKFPNLKHEVKYKFYLKIFQGNFDLKFNK